LIDRVEEGMSYKIKIFNILKTEACGKPLLAFVRTYGCQQNVSDSEKIKNMLLHMGYNFTDKKEEADFILFNTCSVREHAEERVFGNLGELKALKKQKPRLIIALCGCMMEQGDIKEKIKKSFPFVNLIFGTNALNHFPELVYETISQKRPIFCDKTNDNRKIEELQSYRENKIKAFLPVMYGCDNFCSYCIVPYVRGREKSRELRDILKETKTLVNYGYKEITFLGQNVNSYGKNLKQPVGFSRLLRDVTNFEGDYWVRFMTSHPKDISLELIDEIANNDKICKHLHIPFQAGSNRVLDKMNRRYTREKYLSMIENVKKRMKNVFLTSDVIVGFPGETYDDFKQTLSLIKAVRFSSLFTFIYSKRPGTLACSMTDPVPHEEKTQWLAELLDVQRKISSQIYSDLVGTKVKVLIEDENKKRGYFVARTSGNLIVRIEGEQGMIGEFCEVKIIKCQNCVLEGAIINR
jgi:tRNA-2-methylthio-N6-dimethylallyladenosine synthase